MSMRLLVFCISFLITVSVYANDSIKTVIIKPVGDEMRYETTEITARAGSRLKIVMKNTAKSPAMQHNVVVLKDANSITEVGVAAIQAGAPNGYFPAKHESVIAGSKVAPPGETVEFLMTVPPVGEYPYICTFPGHWGGMKGTLYSIP